MSFTFDLQLFGGGKGGGGGVSYSQRPLTAEETALIATQTNYINSLQPAINSLVGKGTASLNDVVTPDYGSLYNNANNQLKSNQASVNSLANGVLPSSYTDSKTDYYNQMYNNSFGSMLASKAKSGIIGGSDLAKANDSMQKNMTAQMSKDYSNDLQTQSGLLSQQQSSIMAPLTLGQAANSASFSNASNYLGLASGQGSQGTDVLNALGSLQNNSTTAYQKSGKGGLF